MLAVVQDSKRLGVKALAALALIVCVASLPLFAFGGKKKKEGAPAEKAKPSILEVLDYSKIAWPPPPGVPRVKYVSYFANEKFRPEMAGGSTAKKTSWMSRMAGGETEEKHSVKVPMALVNPYGMAVDRAGKLYIADGKVAAVFIFNTETKELELIKTSSACKFSYILGLAIDDDGQLYVSDADAHRIDVFDKDRKFIGTITEGLVGPGGLAIDAENRFLYVVDTQGDQVLVYDLDSKKLLRHIGTTGKGHRLTGPGDFSKPTNAAVDKDGNLYVTDTWNDRVEIFDADGNFIHAFGKNGDGPGAFTAPKGIGVDSDGHIWVADGRQDRVQIFTQEGTLLMVMGGHGNLPGQFAAVAGLYIDGKNRVFTSEQYPGRVQMFQYFTDDETKAEMARRLSGGDKKPAAATAKPASPGSPKDAATVPKK